MKFCRRKSFWWTNSIFCSRYIGLNSLIKPEKYTLPKVILEGFLIFIQSKTPYIQVLKMLSDQMKESLDGWEEEYEQIRQNGGM